MTDAGEKLDARMREIALSAVGLLGVGGHVTGPNTTVEVLAEMFAQSARAELERAAGIADSIGDDSALKIASAIRKLKE
jgi:hypothetical protein